MTLEALQMISQAKSGVRITISRLGPNHREANKIYIAFTDPAGATIREEFMTDAEYHQSLQILPTLNPSA